jgi:hypothetical protein
VRFDLARFFRLALATSLTVSALLYFLWSWRWPLVGDASIMHYLAFLIERGWAPYLRFDDMNMPGAYLNELAVMHLYGAGAIAERLYDFTLLATATAAFFSITYARVPLASRRLREAAVGQLPSTQTTSPGASMTASWIGSTDRRLPAIFASSLFILIHGRDGLAQAGQRDLTMAVLLIAATAFLFHSVRRRALWSAAAFGLLSGVTVTIKPTALLLTLIQIALALYVLRSQQSPQGKHLRFRTQFAIAVVAAYLVAPAIALLFLLRERALTAFLTALRTSVPYYASLGHRSLGYLLLHSLSPVQSLFLIWLLILALNRPLFLSTLNPLRDWERATLLAAVLFGFLNCVVQARALPYHRYPLLAFLLPLMALDFTYLLDNDATEPDASTAAVPKPHLGSNLPANYLAIAALFLGGFFLAPQSAFMLHTYRWQQDDFTTSLEHELNALGGPKLSGHIQCIDAVSGCETVFYRMRLVPATGMLLDFALFGDATNPYIQHSRAFFLNDLAVTHPQVIVVTSRLYLADPDYYDNYAKLDRWPAFKSFLADHYTLQTQWTPTHTERWWSREEKPAGYRIYVLRPNPVVQ